MVDSILVSVDFSNKNDTGVLLKVEGKQPVLKM